MSLTTRAAAAAVLLIVPVSAELVWPAVFDHPAGLLVFAVSQLVGWLLLAGIVRGAPEPAGRAARGGRRAVLAGCMFQVLFALVYGVTALDGSPLELSFVLFLLGFVAQFVGGLVWGAALLRTGVATTAGAGVLAVAVLGALAVVVGADPFHDVFLLSSYAGWVVVGWGLSGPGVGHGRVAAAPAAGGRR